MGKEQFLYTNTRPLFDTLEAIARRSGVSRGHAFEDVLRASVAALAAETMEAEYFDAIKAHRDGAHAKRGVDLFPVFLGQAVDAMSRTDNDVLGDLFQGAVSYGEHGLYLTPQPVAELMVRLSVDAKDETADSNTPTICDPCCGSGVLLMEAGKINPRAELIGQDVDARCARITALNLGLRGKFGWVICGNSLTRDVKFVYRIGSFFHESANGLRRGVIRDVAPEQCPVLPEIMHGTKTELFDAVDDQPVAGPSLSEALPSIIEVPQWAFRLEQRLALLHEPEQQSPKRQQQSRHSPQEKREGDAADRPPKTQGELF